MLQFLSDFWYSATTASSSPEIWLVTLMAIIWSSLVFYSKGWRILRFAITLVHEAGHALAALCTGKRVSAINLRFDTSGETWSSEEKSFFRKFSGISRLSNIITAFNGYVAASIYGLFGVVLINLGYPIFFIIVSFIASILILIKIRNFFGFIIMLATLAIMIVLSYYLFFVLEFVALAIAIFLLIGGVKPILELWQTLNHKEDENKSDAERLQELTFIPIRIWIILFLTVSIAALLLSGMLLTEMIYLPGLLST